MDIELNKVKNFLRITHNFDDDYILALIEMAKKFIFHQTGVEYIKGDDIYEMCILQCVSHFYDNRSPVIDKALINVPYTLDALIKDIGMRGK